jgi:hypothetical protein
MESVRVETGDWGPREMKDVTPPRDAPAPDPDARRLPPPR